MAYEFLLPDIGEGLTEAEVVRWLVGVGDPVGVDQPVVEVETDKAVVEIPAPRAGVVLSHGAEAGETVAVGSVLVVIGDAGEIWPPVEESSPAPIVGNLSEVAEELPARTESAQSGDTEIKALPLVRKLARESGVDLAQLSGTGPGGRITREDVLSVAGDVSETSSGVSATQPSASPKPLAAGDERRPLSKLRRTIAANLTRSWEEIPHVTTFDEVDASRLLAARRALQHRHAIKVPLEAILIKAAIPALRQFPEFNASLDGDHLIVRGSYNIGVAVDTPDGLLVAVVSDADGLSLLECAAEVTRLAEGAKGRKLSAGELGGQGFTISNIGALGGGYGTPLVPPDTTAILSVGRADDQPVVREGKVEVAPMMPLSLSYDHRVIDGGLGRRFMAMIQENLTEPALFLAV
jgi:pyruvate dehydrogenase E2 component (dihydrolipoamide acetyltransferase)